MKNENIFEKNVSVKFGVKKAERETRCSLCIFKGSKGISCREGNEFAGYVCGDFICNGLTGSDLNRDEYFALVENNDAEKSAPLPEKVDNGSYYVIERKELYIGVIGTPNYLLKDNTFSNDFYKAESVEKSKELFKGKVKLFKTYIEAFNFCIDKNLLYQFSNSIHIKHVNFYTFPHFENCDFLTDMLVKQKNIYNELKKMITFFFERFNFVDGELELPISLKKYMFIVVDGFGNTILSSNNLRNVWFGLKDLVDADFSKCKIFFKNADETIPVTAIPALKYIFS